MYQINRTERILEILKKYHYVTVEYLVNEIRYSPATIRRDLTFLENQGLVKRSYGGVEIKSEKATPFVFRQHDMKKEKKEISHEASKLVNDGDTIFIDGSTSAQYIAQFLVGKKEITVISNNMIVVSMLGEQGIEAYCTGGYLNEYPGILVGEITNKTYSMFKADVMFFSTVGYDQEYIYENNEIYYQHHNIMYQNSKKRVYLCGSNKIGTTGKIIAYNIDDMDFIISDKLPPQEVINKHKKTKFITI